MESNWRPRGDYPSLKGSAFIGLDLETCDPNLETLGPGDIRGDGFIVGISIATDTFSGYYPIAHEGGDNLPKDVVLRWLARELQGDEPKVGANLSYDLGWLRSAGITVGGPKHDVQIAEALIDEMRDSYELGAIAKTYLGEQGGKDEDLLRAAAAERGWRTPKQVKSNLWRLAARFVGPYGERDAIAPLQVFKAQLELLQADDLMGVYELESRLIDILLEIRFRGMPISYDKAELAMEKLDKEQKTAQRFIDDLAGFAIDPWSGKSLQSAHDKLGYAYPLTAKGNPSFVADWISIQNSDFHRNLLLARQLDRGGNVFIQKKIIDMAVNGRIHPHFRQTRVDEGGTRSGRFSSSKPNMQQVPARHPILAPIIRGCFVADEDKLFGVFDYSQQEPRVTVHYGTLLNYEGAGEALTRYLDNPKIDYHQMVADMVLEVTGLDIGRKAAKTLNLGMAYGMGINKLAAQLGLTVEEAKPVFNAYHQAVRYVRLLGDHAMRAAKRRGWVKTLLGRKRHFPGGEHAHKALNAVIQGSSADMVKQAMVDCFDAGELPYNTMHDEIDFPINTVMKNGILIPDQEQVLKIGHLMTSCVKLNVPLVLDVEIGPSWGEAELWQAA